MFMPLLALVRTRRRARSVHLCAAALEQRCLLSGGPVLVGLTQWLEANVGVTAISGKVSGWADQSGQGHSAAQANSGNQPTLIKNALNGKPVLSFNGASAWMGSVGQPFTSQQFTILAVVSDLRGTTDKSFREVWSNWSTSNEGGSVFLGTANNGPIRARFTDDMGGASDPNHLQTGVGVIASPRTPFLFTGWSGSSDAVIYQNNTLIADHGAALSTRNLAGPYNIGTQLGAGEFWQGNMAEILVYNRALASTELTTDWTYLDRKYSLLPATHFRVSTSPGSPTAGAPFSVTVTALDVFNNTVTGYTGKVHFTTSDTSSQVVLPADYTFVAADRGRHTFTNQATLITAGSRTLTVTDTATSAITTAKKVTVKPAAASALLVFGYPTPVTAGAAHGFTVEAVDPYGNQATGYLGLVHFASSDAAALLPGNYQFLSTDRGKHVFSATLNTPGMNRSITATDTVTSSVSGSETGITVNAGPAAGTALPPALEVGSGTMATGIDELWDVVLAAYRKPDDSGWFVP